MKSLLVLFLLALTLAAPIAHAGTEVAADAEEYALNRAQLNNFPDYQIGTALSKNRVRMEKCTYNFATQGGAVSSINLKNAQGTNCVIPKNAIITNVLIDVITQGATSASGTMALTAQSAGDLKAALAAASYTGIVAGIPVGTAATAIKLTADRTIIGTIATGALTAGKWNVDIQYYLSQ